jgi:hypothetical protein
VGFGDHWENRVVSQDIHWGATTMVQEPSEESDGVSGREAEGLVTLIER